MFVEKGKAPMRCLALVAICAHFALRTSPFAQSEEDKTIDDLQDIANEAGMVISTLQASSTQSIREQQAILTILNFVKASSRETWFAASELNSTDSLYQRNKKVADAFVSLNGPDADAIKDRSVRAAVEALQSGIDILRGRLNEQYVQMGIMPGTGNRVPDSLPARITHRLQKIRAKGITTIAAADSLLGQGR